MEIEGWSQTLTAGPLLLIAAAAIAVLLVLIIKLRVHAFLALIIISALTAFATGIPTGEVVPVLLFGFGNTLASVALLVGLGAMLGRLLETSGGAQVLADRLIGIFGRSAPLSPWVWRHCCSASRSSSTPAWWSCFRWSSPWRVAWAAAC